MAHVADGCAAFRTALGRQLLRERPGPRFGVVDVRQVNLVRVRLRLSRARGCRTWPLLRADANALSPIDAERHRCRLRPYRGPLVLLLRRSDATTSLRAPFELHTDRDGYVEFAFADLDAVLRSFGVGTLDDYDRLDLGEGAWAGAIDLRRFRGLIAEYHYRWIERGRGSAALFLHRHGEGDRGRDANALALEERLARHEHEVRLVEQGRLSPRAFIDRHVWSPFRRIAERLLDDASSDLD